MPLALDLISTLVMGSILPVATTLLARSPFSTLASFEGSILVPPLDCDQRASNNQDQNGCCYRAVDDSLTPLFLPLPLPSTTASCLISNLRTGIHLLLREKLGLVPEKFSSRATRLYCCAFFMLAAVIQVLRPSGHGKESNQYRIAIEGSTLIVPPAGSESPVIVLPGILLPQTIIPLEC